MAAFQDPVTRVVLGSNGSTTLLLEALVMHPLRAQVLRVETVAAGTLPPEVRVLLEVTAAAPLVVRHSLLSAAGHPVVSLNRVYGRADVPSVRRPLGRTSAVPLGHAVPLLRSVHTRDTVAVGVAPWPMDGAPCGYKKYVVRQDDRPMLFLQEMFSPGILPCTPRPLAPEPPVPTARAEAVGQPVDS